jgi:hypothetical protein
VPRQRSGGTARQESRAIRQWAQSQGIEVSTRGRIPGDLVARYREAHPS